MSLSNQIRLGHFVPYIPMYGNRYRVMPTRYGFLYCCMLFALIVGSINHNNNLGYLLTFFLGGLLLVSILFTFRNLSGITVKGQDAGPVFAGQLCRVLLTMEARASSKHGISVALDSDLGQAVDIDKGDRTSLTIYHPAETRGYLSLQFIYLSTIFPFGLVRFQCRRSIDLNCLVFPKPVSTPYQREYNNGAELGDFQHERKGTGDFTGLDLYIPGDSLKRIHWKGLAGGRGIHTKRFEENESASAIFSLQELPGHDLELKLSQLTYMVLTADAEGLEYGLRLGESSIAPNRGLSHKNDCLTALALYSK